jgi:hypothetical protein
MIDEMNLLSRMKDTAPVRAEAFDNARTTLRAAMAVDADRQTRPRTASGGARRGTWRARGRAAGFGVTAVAAAAAAAVALVLTSSSPTPHQPAAAGSRPAAHAAAHSATAGNQQLAQLASYIEARQSSLPGNATLEILNQSPTSAAPGFNGVGVLTDSGDYYYWALTMSGLPQAIAGHDDPSDGSFRREVAAALFAVHGNLAAARARMAVAGFAPGITPRKITVPGGPRLTPEQQADNQIWSNCLYALNAGAANQQVRVGVLRLLATLPQVLVTQTATDGQPTLTLTEAWESPTGQAHDILVINAGTGLPIVTMTRQPDGELTGVTYYHASRVTLADIAAGKP